MNNPVLALGRGRVKLNVVHPEDRALLGSNPSAAVDSIPQAWVASAAQAGLLRVRQQCEKSQGFGDRVPESFPNQTKTETRGKSALAFSSIRRFTLNQYSPYTFSW